ncbi:hypothetical protein ABIB07_007862 [Bradyrhizobium sp. RT10b]
MQTAAKTSTDPTEAIVHLRRGLIAQGYRVVPCSGKKACGLGWSNSKWSAEQMEGLARLYPHGHNTGVLTGSVVAIDVDTPDQATSDAIDLPLKFHPVAVRVSADVTPFGAV